MNPTLVMSGAALMMFIPGIMYLIAPQSMLAAPQIKLATANEFHLVRAAYGGGFLGLAALFGIGVVKRQHASASLLAIATVLTGFAVGRVYSIAVDGMPTTLFLAVLIAEVGFAAAAAQVLRTQQ